MWPRNLAEYESFLQHRYGSLEHNRDRAEHLMARREARHASDPRDLAEHLMDFQRRRGLVVAPLLDMDYHDRLLWSTEYKRDWAELTADREVRHAARLARKEQRRAAVVRHGMMTRSRTRANPPALPTRGD